MAKNGVPQNALSDRVGRYILVDVDCDVVGRPDVVRTGPEAL